MRAEAQKNATGGRASPGKKLAPEVGLEPTTTRLIPTSRDSTIEQILSNPAGGFLGLNVALADHCA